MGRGGGMRGGGGGANTMNILNAARGVFLGHAPSVHLFLNDGRRGRVREINRETGQGPGRGPRPFCKGPGPGPGPMPGPGPRLGPRPGPGPGPRAQGQGQSQGPKAQGHAQVQGPAVGSVVGAPVDLEQSYWFCRGSPGGLG